MNSGMKFTVVLEPADKIVPMRLTISGVLSAGEPSSLVAAISADARSSWGAVRRDSTKPRSQPLNRMRRRAIAARSSSPRDGALPSSAIRS